VTKKQEQRLNLQIVEEYGGDDGTRTRGLFRLTAEVVELLNALFGVAYAGCQPIFDPSVGLPWATGTADPCARSGGLLDRTLILQCWASR